MKEWILMILFSVVGYLLDKWVLPTEIHFVWAFFSMPLCLVCFCLYIELIIFFVAGKKRFKEELERHADKTWSELYLNWFYKKYMQ